MTITAEVINNAPQYQIRIAFNSIPEASITFTTDPDASEATINSVKICRTTSRLDPFYPTIVKTINILNEQGIHTLKGHLPILSDIFLSVLGIHSPLPNHPSPHKITSLNNTTQDKAVYVEIDINRAIQNLHSSAEFLLDSL